MLRRPQLMRFRPTMNNRELSDAWAATWLESAGATYICQAVSQELPLGLLSVKSEIIDESPTQTLSFAFDRCLEGRALAGQSLTVLAASGDLDECHFLVGPSMVNSERTARSIGFRDVGGTVLDGTNCKILRYTVNH